MESSKKLDIDTIAELIEQQLDSIENDNRYQVEDIKLKFTRSALTKWQQLLIDLGKRVITCAQGYAMFNEREEITCEDIYEAFYQVKKEKPADPEDW